MNSNIQRTFIGLVAAIAVAALGAAPVRADTQQTNKNQWRNAAIAAAAATVYGAHNHDKATTALGAAGTAYAASRYEKERKSQSQTRALRARRYHGVGGNARNFNPNGIQANGWHDGPPYGKAYGYRRNHGAQKHHGKGWYKNHGDRDHDEDGDHDDDRNGEHGHGNHGNGHGHGDH